MREAQRALRDKGAKGPRRSKGSSGQELLAGTEDEQVVSAPEVVRAAIEAVEPATVVVVLHVEDAETAVRSADGFHRDHEPLTARLVRVLQPELRPDLSGTQFETHLEAAGADLLVFRPLLEAEIGDREANQINTFLGSGNSERRLSQHVARPVTDPEVFLLQLGAESLSVPDAGADLNGLPDRQSEGISSDPCTLVADIEGHSDLTTVQQLVGVLLTEAVQKSLDLTKVPNAVLHNNVLSRRCA